MFGNAMFSNSILFSSQTRTKKILNQIKLTKYEDDINSIIKNSGPEIVTKEYFSLKDLIGKESLILPQIISTHI